MKPLSKPPAIRGMRAWKSYLAAQASLKPTGNDSSGALRLDDSRSYVDSPDSTAPAYGKH